MPLKMPLIEKMICAQEQDAHHFNRVLRGDGVKAGRDYLAHKPWRHEKDDCAQDQRRA